MGMTSLSGEALVRAGANGAIEVTNDALPGEELPWGLLLPMSRCCCYCGPFVFYSLPLTEHAVVFSLKKQIKTIRRISSFRLLHLECVCVISLNFLSAFFPSSQEHPSIYQLSF
jgi:hypothetical protein